MSKNEATPKVAMYCNNEVDVYSADRTTSMDSY